MNNEKLKNLKMFFIISNASFDLMDAISIETKGYVSFSKMKSLHRIALEELSKDEPNIEKIDRLLFEMEQLCKELK